MTSAATMRTGRRAVTAALAVACVTTTAAPSDQTPSPSLTVEEVVTVGTRGKPRAAVDTAVPVDVFSAEDIASVGSSDLIDAVNAIVPSFNVRRYAIADGATFVRPTELRGLDAHHTLVLIEGKRRHRAALLRLGGFGAHGPDLGSLPSIAIDRLEVLRDGAAAQYGSDAIAGVMDLKLAGESRGLELRARAGGYSAGDGEEVVVEAKAGFPLASGFLTISAQVAEAAPTNRSEPYDIPIGSSGLTPAQAVTSRATVDGTTYYGPDAFTYRYATSGELVQVLPGSDGVPDDLDSRYADNFHRVGGDRAFSYPAQIWGKPEREQRLVVANAGLPVGGSELYAFASYAWKDQTGGFFYRRPGVSQLKPLRLADGSIYDPRTALYPAGFTPQFSGEVTDYAVYGGLRGELANGLTYDLSASYGNDRIDYRIANTLNPSLGPATPTRFRPGSLVNDETALNADFTYPVEVGLADPVNLAFGVERRVEGYLIERGDAASFAVGPFAHPDPFDLEITQAEVDADPNDALTSVACRIPGFETTGSLCPAGDPVNNAVPIGSNGFPGYPPAFATDVDRRSTAAYLDLEVDATANLLANAAARFERFSDFGDVATWKLAGRYRINETTNLHGSVGTGFRAPTPGQISTTNVSTRIDPDGFPRAEGIFPSHHAAAGLFGGRPLDAERARSLTFGVATRPTDGLTVTLDAYRIRLDDRIVLSSQFAVGAQEAARLVALGVPGANDIAQVRFFTNDVATRTRGVDLVAAWTFDTRRGTTSLQAAVNANDTRIVERGRFVDAEGEYDLENGLPRWRAVVTGRHAWRKVDALLRLRYYGEYSNADTAALRRTQTFAPEVMVDAEVTWLLHDRYTVTAGVENLFDNYPDPAAFENCCGRIYWRRSAVSWQGALFRLQVAVSFE